MGEARHHDTRKKPGWGTLLCALPGVVGWLGFLLIPRELQFLLLFLVLGALAAMLGLALNGVAVRLERQRAAGTRSWPLVAVFLCNLSFAALFVWVVWQLYHEIRV
ncbi:MAG: hypothetical protein ACYTGZ_19115 [Planctomycetota bacterium]